MTRSLILAALCASACASPALACVKTSELEGVLRIPFCDPEAHADCRRAEEAVYEYTQTMDMPGVLSIAAQTSPWRIYDGNHRILTVDELAIDMRALRTNEERAYLVGSWTARQPGGGDSLAQRVSAALDGFPVDGTDGFLWLTAAGGLRTTQQAFSTWKSGPYRIREGEDVMAAMVPGAMTLFEDRLIADGLAEGVVAAGVGHDVFHLCPERALAAFERAAAMGSAIGAYNAALMHGESGNRAKAIVALERAVTLGDEKAKARLVVMREREADSVID